MEDKTKYQFTTIKDLMQQVLNKNKLSQGMHQLEVTEAWRNVMGEGVWTYTEKVSYNKGNVTVYYKSSTIREEHSYQKERIIQLLNTYLKTNLIKKIRLL